MAGYGTNEAFAAWLTENGYSLPEGAPAPAVLRQRGSVYIDGTYGDRFVGAPTGGVDQERAWPRFGAVVFGSALASDMTPARVVHAAYEAALQEAREPGSLSVVGSAAQRVKREKVDGAVEVEYQQSGAEEFAGAMTPVMTIIEGLLAPLLRPEAPSVMPGLWSVGCG